jgi:hypothetical protein
LGYLGRGSDTSKDLSLSANSEEAAAILYICEGCERVEVELNRVTHKDAVWNILDLNLCRDTCEIEEKEEIIKYVVGE